MSRSAEPDIGAIEGVEREHTGREGKVAGREREIS